MTIKVEQNALLRVLSRTPSYRSSPSCVLSMPDEEFVFVDIPKSLHPIAEDPEKSSDDRSFCTLSTDSLSTDSESISRRVSFATPLVTAEWTRPWTPREDVSSLYYSTEETTRFRQEYRLERKVLSELSLDPNSTSVETEELSGLFTALPTIQPGRHHISRVVVLHNDKIETFFGAEQKLPVPTASDCDLFDNDSFWSGSLTWY